MQWQCLKWVLADFSSAAVVRLQHANGSTQLLHISNLYALALALVTAVSVLLCWHG
jgi:hypothetical protein